MSAMKRTTPLVPRLVGATASAVPNPARPKYIRLPRAGAKCCVSGLSRTTLFALIKAGAVRSVVVSRAGTIRGARLVNYNSLLAYLRRLEKEQNAPRRETRITTQVNDTTPVTRYERVRREPTDTE